MKSSNTFRSDERVSALVRQSGLLSTTFDAGPAANEPPAEAAANTRQWLFRILAGITVAGVGVAGMVALSTTAVSPFGAFVAMPTALVGLAALACWIDERLASPQPA